MDKNQKSDFVASLSATFDEASVLVVAGHEGISVSGMRDLRVRARLAGGFVKVVKNSLGKLAFINTEFSAASILLSGATVIVYSKDPLVAPKICLAFAKDNEKFSIFGGINSDTGLLDHDGIKALAQLPSLDALHSIIISQISSPMTGIVQCISRVAESLVRVIKLGKCS